MGLRIQTTGLEQYTPGGKANVKALIIGGPGVGKTRWSSYFPRPIYADCEGGLASVADRQVQFAKISSSKEMLDLLVELDSECKKPKAERHWDTIIIDTLDAFSRKVQDEWLLRNPGESTFRGYDAWDYLQAKLQMLLTRLLNLDMNVIVLVHYMDKMITEGTGNDQVQRREYQLQLQGKVKDQVFNDFDLVGWMDTYYAAEGGKRVQKRSLTFKPAPDKQFLKDRLNATPDKLEVNFDETDYTNLFSSIASRLGDFVESKDFGEIPSSDGVEVVAAGAVLDLPDGGALPPITPQEIPLMSHDKPTLMKMARDLGLKPPANLLKSELVDLIDATVKAVPETIAVEEAIAVEAPVEVVEVVVEAETEVVETEIPVVDSPSLEEVPDGTINEETGEFVEETPSMGEAIENVQSTIGAEVLDIVKEPEPVVVEPVKKIAICEVCGTDLTKEPSQDHVTLAWIKTRKRLCNKDWEAEQIARRK